MMTNATFIANPLQTGITTPSRARVASKQLSRRAFFAVLALLFVAGTVVTVFWCHSMSAMGNMPMPGGWTMSMAWMRMPGQTWAGAMASFVAMWLVMMAAMMLPSLAPALWRYRRSVESKPEALPDRLTALVGLGYFFVWTLLGVAVFPLGAAAAAIEMSKPSLARAVPFALGVMVIIAGVLQFTRWKTRHLASCRETPDLSALLPAHHRAAWHRGLHLGLHCGLSCANLTAILLVAGVMDLRIMFAVTAAITAERLAPAGERAARIIGAVALGAGLLLIMRAGAAG